LAGLALCGAALLLTAMPASASLIAYEGFAPGGPSGSIAGTADGTGFTGPWQNSVGPGRIDRTGDNNGLTAFPSNIYFAAPTGGKAQHGTWYDWKAVVRPLGTPIDLDADGVIYMSWLFHDDGSNRDHDARVFLGRAANQDAGDPGLRLYCGLAYTKDLGIAARNAEDAAWGWNANFGQAFGTATPAAVGPAGCYFMVARLQTSAFDLDTMTLRAYKFVPGDTTLVDTDPNNIVWDVTFTGNFSGQLNELGIFAAGLGFPEFDEIRVGTTWEDVANTTPPSTPSILGQPRNETVARGATVSFVVQAAGAGALSYRWQKEVSGNFANLTDGGNIAGVTTSTLTLANVQSTDAGNYRVVVSSGGVSTNSAPASLTVVGEPETAINLHAGIVVNGQVGFHYRVEYRSAVDPTDTWTLLQDIPSLAVSPLTVYDAVPANQPQRFYRAIIVP
jgi:hypothetical protein